MFCRFYACQERGVGGRVVEWRQAGGQFRCSFRVAAGCCSVPVAAPLRGQVWVGVVALQADQVEYRVADGAVRPVEDDVAAAFGADVAGVEVAVDEGVGDAAFGQFGEGGRQVVEFGSVGLGEQGGVYGVGDAVGQWCGVVRWSGTPLARSSATWCVVVVWMASSAASMSVRCSCAP